MKNRIYKLCLLLVMFTMTVSAQISQSPTTFNNGIKLPNITEDITSSEVLVRDTNGVVGYTTDISNSIKRTDIDLSSPTNTRNDQSSIIKLDDNRLVVAYSHFAGASTDVATSEIWHAFSNDNGNSWEEATQLVDVVSIGSYIPSFYKKSNGNILMVFFVRETASPHTSTLRAIEYSADMTTIVTPMYTILNEGTYTPLASDRLFYDKTNDRLLLPYPTLVSGPGNSTVSVYSGGLLISEDEGATWSDSGLVINGKLDVKGFGGALETGVFQNQYGKLTYYFRTTVGSVYAVDLTANGITYTSSAVYNLNVSAQNAMSSIKYIDELKTYLAVYTKLVDSPFTPREILEISTSLDGVNWSPIGIVDRSVFPLIVNEPNIFELDKKIIISYSVQDVSGEYSLKTVNYPKEFFTSSGTKYLKRTSNPVSGSEAFTATNYVYDFSDYSTNTFGAIERGYVNINGSVDMAANRSFYNKIEHVTVAGQTGADSLNIDDLSQFVNFSPQELLDNVHLDNMYKILLKSPSIGAMQNGSTIDKLVLLGLKEHTPPLEVGVAALFGIHQTGLETKNYFEGNIGLGTETPTERLEVIGNIKSDAFKTNGGTSDMFTKGDGTLDANTYALDSNVMHTTGGLSEVVTGGKKFQSGGNSPISLSGTGTGIANVLFLPFFEVNNVTRQAYVGFPSGGHSDFTIRNDVSSSSLTMAEEGGINGLEYNNATVYTSDNLTPANYALDADVVHKTGGETITGTKTFNPTSTEDSIIINDGGEGATGITSNISSNGIGMFVNNTSGEGLGISVSNTGTGTGIFTNNTQNGRGISSTNSGSGQAIKVSNTSSGNGIRVENVGTGTAITSNAVGASTGRLYAGANSAFQIVFEVSKDGDLVANTIETSGYTVATLPTGSTGMTAYVTDATAPTYLGTLTGGGVVVCPVFFDGTNWVSH